MLKVLSRKGNGLRLFRGYKYTSTSLILISSLIFHFCTNTANTVDDDPVNNLKPVANAGNDTTVQINGTIKLHGTGSDPDGNIVEYAWKLGSNVDWVVTSTSDTSIKATPPPRTEDFYFRAKDNNLEYTYDTVQITIKGLPPNADAGDDKEVKVNEKIELYGAASDDDGNIIEYAWKFGSAAAWVVTSTGDTSVHALPPARVDTFYFRVKDNDSLVTYDSLQITIKTIIPPVANAGNDTSVLIEESINLHGVGTDEDGFISEYAWKLGSDLDWIVTSTGDTSIIASAPAREDTFYFRVKDNDGAYGYDSLQITITNTVPIPPVANAGNDTTVKINETINLHGTGTDADGYITEYAWQIGNSGWIITAGGDTSFAAPSSEQMLVCILRVKDNDNEVDFDSVNISVQDTGYEPWIPTGPLEYYKGMVKVKAKEFGFQMGSDSGKAHERPVHTVSFTYDFWIDTVEVAQGKYQSVMSTAYSGFTKPSWSQQNGLGSTYPVYNVNWFDAVLFCNALSKNDGLDTVYSFSSITGTPGNDCVLGGISIDLTKIGYRLATEAEWEYSCRGGTATEFFWGAGNVDVYAWSSSNSSSSQPVGTKTPNAYGIYDMSGNLWEWCHDWYANSYNAGLHIDPLGPSSGSERVMHGGGWYYGHGELRSANRNYAPPDTEGRDVGFRTVLPVQ